MKFVKYNIGIIITAIFMGAMSYWEYVHPRYGHANVPKIYLLISVVLVLLLTVIYFKYFREEPRKVVRIKKKGVRK